MKNLFQITIVFLTLVFIFSLNSCKNPEKTSVVRKVKPWDKLILNVDDIEEAKAAKKKVQERITYSKFYNKFGKLDTTTYLAERIFYNSNGKKEKQIQYLSTGDVDIAWSYEYENDVEKKITAKNRFDQIVYERLVKFDNDGDEIEIKEFNQKVKDYYKSFIRYDKNKLVKEIYTIDNFGRQLSKQTFEYNNERLSKIYEYDKLNQLVSEVELQYTAEGKLTKEIRKTKPFDALSTKTVKYKDGKIYQIDDNEMLITYDYKGNNIIKEHYAIHGVGPQRRFDYFYNKKGLLKTKVSVSGIGKPELHIF